MVNPQRAMDPRYDDPVTRPLIDPDPLDPRLKPTANEAFSNQNMYREGFGGTALLIAAILLALGVVSYFVFASSSGNRPLPPERPAASAPANPSGAPSSAPSSSGPIQTSPSGSTSAPSGSSTTGSSSAPAQGTQPTPQPAQPAPAQ